MSISEEAVPTTVANVVKPPTWGQAEMLLVGEVGGSTRSLMNPYTAKPVWHNGRA